MTEPRLTLSTPCAACPHPYNWHIPGGQCQAGDEEKHCGCIAFAVPAPAATRLTVDNITSDQLDQLQDRLKAEQETSRRLLAQRQEMAAERYAWQERGDRAEAELQRLREESPWLRATAEDLADAKAAIARVRALRTDWLSTGAPPIGTSIARWWDKRLIELDAALDEPKEPTT
ncbi:hypothetical protein [Streptomyces sp. V1I1]|uniref:hypothetical protein n=1 Tax=Streptomyces sp. V1I1 TaxID=3042272 RepID=UPI002787FC3E|nr:hypothetical protein [Streptomyces sp. V1I1]MDQ0943299.1 hypothetical protein [Streptomyces sp. V1I1]